MSLSANVRRPARPVFAGLLFLAFVLAAACGGGGDDDPDEKEPTGESRTNSPTATAEASATAPTQTATTASKGACALLPKAEAAAILGSTLSEGEASEQTCDYNGDKYRLTLKLSGHGGTEGAAAELARLRAGVDSAPRMYTDTAAAQGVGDEAFVTLYHYSDGQGTAWIVYARRGATVLNLSLVVKPGNSGPVDDLKAVAAKAAGRVEVTAAPAATPDATTPAAPPASGAVAPTAAPALAPTATPTKPPAGGIADAAATRVQLLALARSHTWGAGGAGAALVTKWKTAIPGLKVNGSAVAAASAVSIYDNLLFPKDVASNNNPPIFAFAVMDSAGLCAAAVGFGFPAIDFFLDVDVEGGKCSADTVVAITRAKY